MTQWHFAKCNIFTGKVAWNSYLTHRLRHNCVIDQSATENKVIHTLIIDFFSHGLRSVKIEQELEKFDFSILYNTIPHAQLKSRQKEPIQRWFSKKNRQQMYNQYVVVDKDKSYFVQSHSNYYSKCKQDEIIQMLSVLIDNIFVQFGVSTDDWYSNGC